MYKLLRGTHSRIESGGRVTYQKGDTIEDLTEAELNSFPDKFEEIEQEESKEQGNEKVEKQENEQEDEAEELLDGEEFGVRDLKDICRTELVDVTGYSKMKKNDLLLEVSEELHNLGIDNLPDKTKNELMKQLKEG